VVCEVGKDIVSENAINLPSNLKELREVFIIEVIAKPFPFLELLMHASP
jgi:hypothetical protein